MKRYIFPILIFIGCFFLGFFIDDNLVGAVVVPTVSTDSYDSRVLGIELSGLSPRTSKIKLHEVEYCQEGEEGCNSYLVGEQTLNLKDINVVEYTATGELTTTISYTIVSSGDGLKYFFIETYQGETYLNGYSCFFEHQLSTLNQRVVVNPDAQGNPMHVYNKIQYSSVRKIDVIVNLLEEEEDLFSGEIYICENSNCSGYVSGEEIFSYYITSFNDGVKKINIYLVRKDQTITDAKDKVEDLTNKSQVISKDIYLDTIGPEITIEGGNWVWLDNGKTYTAQKATCKDSVFDQDACTVTNDADIVKIDYSSDKYQIVTYEASDRLGNVKTETVKIKVELAQDNNNFMTYLIISGSVLLLTVIILGYVLIKNNEKKKKMSYI